MIDGLPREPEAGVPEPARGDEPATKGKKGKKVYEAGGVIACDGKVALRLTDEQHWIFPKGKLKKHETPVDAAIREAVEETGLAVEVVGDAGEVMVHFAGKKRRFVFYLMRATDKTADWPRHLGRDTFLIPWEEVGQLVRHKGYARLWAACRERLRELLDEPRADQNEYAAAGER